jgi:hypothetical protein
MVWGKILAAGITVLNRFSTHNRNEYLRPDQCAGAAKRFSHFGKVRPFVQTIAASVTTKNKGRLTTCSTINKI